MALFIMKSEDLLWLPVILGLIVHGLGIPLLMFGLKGPLLGMRVSDITDSNSESYMHLMSEDIDDDIELSSTSSEAEPDPSYLRRQPTSVKGFQYFYRILPYCMLPGAIYMFRDFGESYRLLLPYWMSRRFHWDLRGVGWVHLGETLFTSLIIALMPWFRKLFLQKHEGIKNYQAHDDSEAKPENLEESKLAGISATNQDLSLAQICLGFSLLGSLLLSMSWYRPSAFVSLAVLAVGMGFPDSYNSFLAGKVDKEKRLQLQDIYLVLSMVGMVAACLGGSIISGIYSLALRRTGDSWTTSTPMWVGAASFGVAWYISRRHKL